MVDKNSTPNEPPKTATPDVQGAFLTSEEISSYQELFKREFGIELTKAQALDKGARLVRLLRVVLDQDY